MRAVLRPLPVRVAASLLGAALIAVALLPVGTAGAQAIGVVPPLVNDVELEVLTTQTQDPTVIQVTSDGRVIWGERKGAVKVLLPSGDIVQAGRLPVAANECADCPDNLNEGGLHGMLLAKDFPTTGRLYLYYSVPSTRDPVTKEGRFHLSVFTLRPDNTLDLESEEVVLEVPAEWDQCCHYGGDLAWMPDGTIVLAVADDTNPFESNGYAPIDRRDGREAFNALRTSQNPADRRGKVLRLNPDGSVPADNPHVDDPAYDPYVYAMGFRSNYRLSVDERTGTVYVGNVGPDAGSANANRGPAGYDELEVIPPGGGTNHGWPKCIANNVAYDDWDFTTSTSSGKFSCDGMTPAALYYQGSVSTQWPQLRTGGRTAMVGGIYRYRGDGPLKLPARFTDKLFFFEWSRNNVYTVPVRADGTLDVGTLSVQHEGISPRHAHDAEVGPDGALYLIEYGNGFWNRTDSRLSRIKCAGCTSPASPPAEGAAAGGTAAAPATAGVAAPQGLAALAGLVLLLLGLRRRTRVA